MANKKGSALLRTVTVIVIVGILGGIYFVFSSLFSQKEVIPAEKIAAVSREDIVRSVVATGKIEPVSKIDIKAKSSGIIQYMYVEEGQQVSKGQILLELDREQLQASVRESEANVMARKAMLEKSEAELKSAGLAQERARAEAESQDLEFTRREWERMQKLYTDNLISKSDLDVAEQRFRAQQVTDKVLKKNILLRDSEYYSAQKGIHQASADLHATEAILQRAQEDLNNTTIRSPIDGTVLKRFLEAGDAVSSILALGSNATLIMTIGDTRELYFRGDVDESDVGQIRVGLPVNLSVETFRDKVFPGEVSRISPMGQEKENVTRFEVQARLSTDTASLRANMSANAEIVLLRKAAVLIVPEASLVYDAQKSTFVDRIREKAGQQVVDRIPVKTGISNGSKVEIVEGLSLKDRVVIQ